jgi:hypothetical protein
VHYKTGFGLNDWIYCALYTHTTRNYTQLQRYRYSTHITVHLCTLIRVLRLHWSYPSNGFITVSHTKSSFHSLIPFLPLFCNCQHNSNPSSSPGRLAFRTRLSTLDSTTSSITGPLPSSGCPSVAFVRFAGLCLPSRCLAMGIHVTVFSDSFEITDLRNLNSTVCIESSTRQGEEKRFPTSLHLFVIYPTLSISYIVEDRMINEYGTVGGMRTGPVPLHSPQISHDLGSNLGCCRGKPVSNRLSSSFSYSSRRPDRR